jgi:hypothetical protein
MVSPLAFHDLHSILTARTTLIPVTGGVMTGFAFAMFRGNLGRMLLFGKSDSTSLMNFSSTGTLRCICGEKHPEGIAADRRQFCRSCGCEVVAKNTAMLDKHLSKREIKAMTATLKRAAIRASHLELPPAITTVQQLNEYLAGSEPKQVRVIASQPTQVEQSRVH